MKSPVHTTVNTALSSNILKDETIAKPPAHTVKAMESPTTEVPYAQYVIVGTGTAAYSAMEAIRNLEPTAKVIMIGEEHDLPYLRPPLSKELWFSGKEANIISEGPTIENLEYKDWQGHGRSVFYLPKEAYKVIVPSQLLGNMTATSGQVQIIPGYPVENLDVEKNHVVLKNGQRIRYDKVLIATGGSPRVPEFVQSAPEDAQSKLMTFRTLKDYQKLLNWSKTDQVKTIVVVGGGFLGSELSVALAHKAKETGSRIIQVFPEKGNMALVFPHYLTEWTTKQLEKAGVEVRPSSIIKQIEVNLGKQVALHLDSGEHITADRVILATGLNPNSKIADASGLETDPTRGGILVNAELEARSNVFVAGDVCSYHDIALGRRRVEHHDHAIMSGKQAGENMVGRKKAYMHQSMFWSDLGPKISYEAVGVLDSKLNTVGVWAKQSEESSEDYDKGVVFYMNSDRRIVGILLWNIHGKVGMARKVLAEHKTLKDVKLAATLFNIHSSSS